MTARELKKLLDRVSEEHLDKEIMYHMDNGKAHHIKEIKAGTMTDILGNKEKALVLKTGQDVHKKMMIKDLSI